MLVTKLKNFSRQWYCKFTAYLLILTFMAGSIWAGLTALGRIGEDDTSIISSRTYVGSDICAQELSRVIDNVLLMQYQYINEENVRNGGAVDNWTLYNSLYDSNAFQRYRDEYFKRQDGYTSSDDAIMGYEFSDDTVRSETIQNELIPGDKLLEVIKAHPDWGMFSDNLFLKYLFETPGVVEQERMVIIKRQLENFQRVQTFLNSLEGKFVYYTYRSETQTGMKTLDLQQIKSLPVHAEYDVVENCIAVYHNNQNIANLWLGNDGYIYSQGYYLERGDYSINVKDEFAVGITQNYLDQREAAWRIDHTTAASSTLIIAICLVLAFAMFIYLCLVTGRQPNSGEVHLYLIDRMFSEIHVAMLVILCVIATLPLQAGINYSEPAAAAPILMAVICGAFAIALPLFLSLLRSLKARRFIRSFAVGRLCIRFGHWVVRFIRAVWNGGSMMVRGILVAIFVPLLCIPWITIPFIILAAVFLIYRTVARFQKVQAGVREVKSGNLDFKINIQGGDLGALAEDINTLSEGLDNAISSEVRAERLKTELISNVSHDIKTPLTSIVTYVDLLQTELSKETPCCDKMREYTDVIAQKTERLRGLTTDLFEAAKATSGAMNVELEQVDVSALVRQALGEFDDKLTAAQLDVRINIPEKLPHIWADGRLVWRIIENLLSNVVKYALPGSRVYWDVTRGHGMVTLTMKNISAYELNVPAEELLERFKRGDEARSSEGSGLGLSIAMSLAKLQHGIFNIEVDGDLFKATLSMPEFIPSFTKEDRKSVK